MPPFSIPINLFYNYTKTRAIILSIMQPSRSWLMIGLATLFIFSHAFVTLFIYTRQNDLIAGQIEQRTQLTDINQQLQLNETSRRVELLSTLYDRVIWV